MRTIPKRDLDGAGDFICLALAGLITIFLTACGPTAQEKADTEALIMVETAEQPVAPVHRESLSAGSPRDAVQNSMPTGRGAKVFRGEFLRNDAVSSTVAKSGIPDAVEATTDYCLLFYRSPARTVVIDNSGPYTHCHGLIPNCSWKVAGAVVKDLPVVPGYVRVFGFDEPADASWPVTLSSAEVTYFSVPLIPQSPPSETKDGADYTNVAQKILSKIVVENSGADYDRAQRAFMRLAEVASVSGLTWKLYVYDATYDAGYGVPDGSIFITTKLVERLNDDQLTAVLGHLMAHERYGHSRNSMKRVNQASAAFFAGSVLLFLPTMGQSVFYLVPAIGFQLSSYRQMLSYLDGEELEADALAAQYLAQLHIPPQTLVGAMYEASRHPISSDEYSWGDMNLWFGRLHKVEEDGPAFGKLLDAGHLRFSTAASPGN